MKQINLPLMSFLVVSYQQPTETTRTLSLHGHVSVLLMVEQGLEGVLLNHQN
jgi:hypothetical protein